MSMNQDGVEDAVRATLVDSKVSGGIYKRLGIEVAGLKKAITQEISRGIASGLGYGDIARNLANATGAPFSRTKTIARTEGHRIQQASAAGAQQAAKDRGADVVKQWDAALDGKTRPSHRQVDGEIRELDEKFSNGLMYPGDPNGPASEVINCRCTSDTRARWALDEEELQTLKDRAAFFGLDKTENFEDFRRKYLDAAQQIATSDVEKYFKEPLENSGNGDKMNIGIQFFAKIPEEKFTAYSLNPQKAPDKAKAFKEALGYDMSNFEDLMYNIDSHIDENKFVEKGDIGYGMRYEYVVELEGANGKRANVLTAWIQDGEEKRLTSAYVTKKKVTE